MVYFNEKTVNSLRKLSEIINNNQISKIIYDDIKDLAKLLGISDLNSFTFELFESIVKLSKKLKLKINRVIKEINDIGIENLNFDRIEKLFEYKVDNPYSNDIKFHTLKYGEDLGKIKFEKRFQKLVNNSPYKINFWLGKGFSKEEAIVKIIDYKKNKSTSLESFINRHGEIKGTEMFEKFKESSKHTKEKYIIKYGKDLGLIKWNEFVIKKKNNSVFTINYWLNKGFDEIESEQKRSEFHKLKLNSGSVDFWINKGLSIKESIKKVDDILIKKSVKFRSASKESLKIFDEVIKNIEGIDYFIGVSGNKEFSIYDDESKKIYYYDFVIPSLKLIFEYHGERFHPHKSIKGSDLINWKTFNVIKKNGIFIRENIDGLTIRKKDLLKERLAKKNGFKYHVIWSSDNKIKAIEKILKIIKNESSKNNKK